MLEVTRKDKIVIEPQLLNSLYNECNGWRERIYEKLVEEKGIKIGNSTLTRLLRELDIEKRKSQTKTSIYTSIIRALSKAGFGFSR